MLHIRKDLSSCIVFGIDHIVRQRRPLNQFGQVEACQKLRPNRGGTAASTFGIFVVCSFVISIAAGIGLVIKNLVLQIANVQSNAISLQGGLRRGKARQAYDTFLPSANAAGADADAGLLKINGAHAPNNEGNIIDGE